MLILLLTELLVEIGYNKVAPTHLTTEGLVEGLLVLATLLEIEWLDK